MRTPMTTLGPRDEAIPLPKESSTAQKSLQNRASAAKIPVNWLVVVADWLLVNSLLLVLLVVMLL